MRTQTIVSVLCFCCLSTFVEAQTNMQVQRISSGDAASASADSIALTTRPNPQSDWDGTTDFDPTTASASASTNADDGIAEATNSGSASSYCSVAYLGTSYAPECTAGHSDSGLVVTSDVYTSNASVPGPLGGQGGFGATASAQFELLPMTGVSKGLLTGTMSLLLSASPTNKHYFGGSTACGSVSVLALPSFYGTVDIYVGETLVETINASGPINIVIRTEEVVPVSGTIDLHANCADNMMIGTAAPSSDYDEFLTGGSMLSTFEVESTSSAATTGVVSVSYQIDDEEPVQVELP